MESFIPSPGGGGSPFPTPDFPGFEDIGKIIQLAIWGVALIFGLIIILIIVKIIKAILN